MEAPQGRYRIVERDRRLVTIDTVTGHAVGVSGDAPAQSAPVSLGMGRAATTDQAPRSALAPVYPSETSDPKISKELKGQAVALVLGSIVALIFLIATGLWFVPVIAFAIPPVRAAMLKKAKEAVQTILDGAF